MKKERRKLIYAADHTYEVIILNSKILANTKFGVLYLDLGNFSEKFRLSKVTEV